MSSPSGINTTEQLDKSAAANSNHNSRKSSISASSSHSHPIKKSSVFGNANPASSSTAPSSSSSGSSTNSSSAATKGSSSSIFIHKPNKDKVKRKLGNVVPIYDSNGKVITAAPLKRQESGKSLQMAEDKSEISVKQETVVGSTDSTLSTVNGDDDVSKSVSSSFKESLHNPHGKTNGSHSSDSKLSSISSNEVRRAAAAVLGDESATSIKEDSDTDKEEEQAVPTHKGRRLIRKMEYDDQIQKRRALSTNSDEGRQRTQSPPPPPRPEQQQHKQQQQQQQQSTEAQEQLNVLKRKRSGQGSDSNNSRSSSPSRKRNFSAKDALGRTKLQKCCIKGNLEMAKEFIRAGADVNQPDHAGNTPLHEAALNGHYEIAKLLIDNGAEVNIQSGVDDLDTPLIDACAYNHLEIIKLLLDKGADPTLVNASGQSAMDSIDPDEDGAVEATKLIRSAMKNFGSSASEHQHQHQQQQQAQQQHQHQQQQHQHPNLQRNDTWIDLTTKEGREEIYHRAADGDEAFVGNYLANGGKPHPKALIFAARHGHSNVVSLLLAFGAKIEKAVEGESALMQTVGRGHYDTVQMLLDNGANPTRVNNDGVSVLDRAKDPNLVTDTKEIALIEEAIKNHKGASAPTTNNDKEAEEIVKSNKRKQVSGHEVKAKDRKLKRKLELEQEAADDKSSKRDVKLENDSDHEERAKLQKKAKLKQESIEDDNAVTSKESTPGFEAKTTVRPSKKTETPPPPPPALTPAEEEAKRLREAELAKQREQWELHKRAQREAKAADIMKSIEENKKRREEEEKKLEQRRLEELEQARKAEEEAKLKAEQKLQEFRANEEIERRKAIREYYVPGLKSATFNQRRTVEEALMYLPLNVITIDDKDYVCDLQVMLFLGLEKLHETHPQISKFEITESDKGNLWRFFYPIIGFDRSKRHSTQEMETLRIDGLAKFQSYQLWWLLLDDVSAILHEPEYEHLKRATQIRWITRIELKLDDPGEAALRVTNNMKSSGIVADVEYDTSHIRESAIPYKFRGNKKFLQAIALRKKKFVWDA